MLVADQDLWEGFAGPPLDEIGPWSLEKWPCVFCSLNRSSHPGKLRNESFQSSANTDSTMPLLVGFSNGLLASSPLKQVLAAPPPIHLNQVVKLTWHRKQKLDSWSTWKNFNPLRGLKPNNCQFLPHPGYKPLSLGSRHANLAKANHQRRHRRHGLEWYLDGPHRWTR